MAELSVGGRDQPSPAGSDKDREFEPTVDMMVNDFDDEGTMEEAEASESAEEQRAEADLLKQERDMPIEKLLAMYGGYPSSGAIEQDDTDVSQSSDASEEILNNQDLTLDKAVIARDLLGEGESGVSAAPAPVASVELPAAPAAPAPAAPLVRPPPPQDDAGSCGEPPQKKPRRSALAALYPELEVAPAAAAAAGQGKRSLRSAEDGQAPAEEGEESDSTESSADESSWRKTIQVGPDYQAHIPAGLRHYGDSRPYENVDKLLWDPGRLAETEVERYQTQAQELRHRSSAAAGAAGSSGLGLTSGSNSNSSSSNSNSGTYPVRDHEQTLYLLQQCDHNVDEALRRAQMNAHQPLDTLSLWSEEECANFENGLRFYGKDFYTIQQQKVRTRSVGELVQFYYLWKKTERHDVFANKNKLEKRKYALNPCVTDFMERFLEEQDRGEPVQQVSSAVTPAVTPPALHRGQGDSARPGRSLQILMAAADQRWTGAGADRGHVTSSAVFTDSVYPPPEVGVSLALPVLVSAAAGQPLRHQ